MAKDQVLKVRIDDELEAMLDDLQEKLMRENKSELLRFLIRKMWRLMCQGELA